MRFGCFRWTVLFDQIFNFFSFLWPVLLIILVYAILRYLKLFSNTGSWFSYFQIQAVGSVVFKYRQLVQLFSNTGSWFGYFQIQAVGSVFSNHQCYFIKHQLFFKTESYLPILKFIFGNSCIVSVHIFLVSQLSDTDNYSIFWYCYRYLQILSFTILVVLVIFKPF